MKKQLAILAVWVGGAVGFLHGQSPEAGSPALTLREAACRAVEQNPQLKAAAAEREAAGAGTRQARSGFYPRIDFRESFTNGNNPVYAFGTKLGQQSFTAADFDVHALNHPDPLNNLKSELTLYQSIWEGGRVQAQNALARLNERLREYQEEQARQGLLFEVVRNYFGIQLAGQALQTMEDSIRSAKASLERVNNLFAAGVVVESDLLRLQVFVSDLERQRLEAEHQLQMARAALDTDLGLTLGSSFHPATPLQLPGSLPAEEAACQAAAREHRPEIKQMQNAVLMVQQQIRDAKSDFLPGIGFFTTLEYNIHPSFDATGGNYVLGIQMRWNVFDGQRKGARLAEVKAGLSAQEARLQNLQNLIALQVKDAFLKLQTARRQHEVALQATGQAAEGLRIVKNRYEAGMANLTDLLSAEAAVSGARLNLTRALYQINLSRAALELASGRLTLENPIFE